MVALLAADEAALGVPVNGLAIVAVVACNVAADLDSRRSEYGSWAGGDLPLEATWKVLWMPFDGSFGTSGQSIVLRERGVTIAPWPWATPRRQAADRDTTEAFIVCVTTATTTQVIGYSTTKTALAARH